LPTRMPPATRARSGAERASIARASTALLPRPPSSASPGGDYDAYVDAHVRRLEALRRAGIVERADADRWLIPENFEDRAAAYDATKGRQASLRILCAYDLDRQVTSDAPTWLDPAPATRHRAP